MNLILTAIDIIAANSIFRMVALAIVFDTFFGVIRAIRHRCFNSCFGIDGAIRKISMLASMVFLAIVDNVIHINLIGFIPEEVLKYLPLEFVGLMEFFALLYLAYEAVSILKNMYLCGLPVKRIWIMVRKFLGTYTDELPDDEGIV